VNGVHDMGGTHGYGPIRPRENDETFHDEWEKRVPGLSGITRLAGIVNIDESRHGIERMPPDQYLTATYYERHLFTVELNLIEKGILSSDEIERRIELLQRDPSALPRRDDPALAERVVSARLRSEFPTSTEPRQPRFKPGDGVIARNIHPTGHTRLPRYARGKRGVIDLYHGVDILPDANAHGRGPSPEPLYSVRFEASELWGASADGPGSVNIDLWESYLEPLAEEKEDPS
jgi:nitrile hydratase